MLVEGMFMRQMDDWNSNERERMGGMNEKTNKGKMRQKRNRREICFNLNFSNGQNQVEGERVTPNEDENKKEK